jgi:hypothetical protein
MVSRPSASNTERISFRGDVVFLACFAAGPVPGENDWLAGRFEEDRPRLRADTTIPWWHGRRLYFEFS